jgi:hypothetical protein
LFHGFQSTQPGPCTQASKNTPFQQSSGSAEAVGAPVSANTADIASAARVTRILFMGHLLKVCTQFRQPVTGAVIRARITELPAYLLNELSYLIRGVRPMPDEETPPGEELSEHPPPLRIVLSLREDCLGLLEDAAEHIPQILDARFRLAPLDLRAAYDAILRPVAVIDPGLETPPFAVIPQPSTRSLNIFLTPVRPSLVRTRATSSRFSCN